MSTGEATGETTQLGRYRLRGRLGEGGMGIVHLGIDPSGRAVAVKVLRAHIAHDPDARARLAREVSTLQRVRHPLVAEVLDADVEGEQPYVVTRFVPGAGLDVLVRDHGPMPAPALLRVGRGLSAALGAIHAVHVVHRDLKPGNVLMKDGDPVVIDFGIAHVADDVRLTSTGLVMGTPGYLSPEVIDGGQVTRATDWWGWAATLAFAASGRPPFGRGPMDVVIDRVRRGQCDLDGVDERLRPLLSAALAVEPTRRPHADEVLAALDRYAAGEHATVTLAVLPPRASRTPVRLSAAPAAPPVAPGAVRPGPAAGSAARPALAVDPWRPPPVAEVPPGPHLGPALVDAPRPPVRPRRTPVVLALGAALVAFASAFPALALATATALVLVARTTDRVAGQLGRRRYERGRRRSDGWAALAASPWHLLRGLLATALAAVAPLLLGAATAFSTGLVLPAADGTPAPGSSSAVAAGALIALLASWWGLGGGSLRRGGRAVLRGVVPTSVQLASAALLLVAGAGCVWWAVRSGGPTWWPLSSLPFGIPLPR